ncbi:hypothetical protein EVAR_50418_1 [Eumeta japonica]|uniref:Uncharacterized protein n=1 Tax=Eumeta variegata TaxID=151549 RepID=A0A4C1WVN3_EUMVA|nr:hypothetical protein EVAR_50418_1 [Eumeta japonica]
MLIALEEVDTLALNNIPDIIKITDKIDSDKGALSNSVRTEVENNERTVSVSPDHRNLSAEIISSLSVNWLGSIFTPQRRYRYCKINFADEQPTVYSTSGTLYYTDTHRPPCVTPQRYQSSLQATGTHASLQSFYVRMTDLKSFDLAHCRLGTANDSSHQCNDIAVSGTDSLTWFSWLECSCDTKRITLLRDK